MEEALSLFEDFSTYRIKMKNTTTKLVALVAVASSLARGASTFASTSTASTTSNKPAVQTREFRSQTGHSTKADRLAKLSEQLGLTASQKTQFEQLLTQFKTERKAYHEQRKTASTQEAKEKLKTQREQRKTEIKNQILALVPADQKSKVEALLSKSKHGAKKGGKRTKATTEASSSSQNISAKKQRTTATTTQN